MRKAISTNKKTTSFILLYRTVILSVLLLVLVKPIIETSFYLSDTIYELSDVLEEEESKKEKLEEDAKEDIFFEVSPSMSNNFNILNNILLSGVYSNHSFIPFSQHYLDVASPPPDLA